MEAGEFITVVTAVEKKQDVEKKIFLCVGSQANDTERQKFEKRLVEKHGGKYTIVDQDILELGGTTVVYVTENAIIVSSTCSFDAIPVGLITRVAAFHDFDQQTAVQPLEKNSPEQENAVLRIRIAELEKVQEEMLRTMQYHL